MRTRKWTETAIKLVFDDFIKEHDRLPTKYEMYEKYSGKFPRPLSIKLTTGITIGEYFRLYYPTYLNRCQSRVYGKQTKEYWIENFSQQYAQLGEPPKDEYDKLRASGTPNSKTLTRIVGVSTWSELLNYCGFQKDKKRELEVELIFEETLENYQKLDKTLKDFLATLK